MLVGYVAAQLGLAGFLAALAEQLSEVAPDGITIQAEEYGVAVSHNGTLVGV